MSLKDDVLASVAKDANVAQFVSFAPGDEPSIRHAYLAPASAAPALDTAEKAIAALLRASVGQSVNVRSFRPSQPKGNEFIYGLNDTERALAEVRRLASAGFYTIVNETIDVSDGGVSGVSYGGVLEFAPDDTPRCVDRPGTVAFARPLGLKVLQSIYGFVPELNYPENMRVEFSLHPLRCGLRRKHLIIWELEEAPPLSLTAAVSWPNRFSRHVGDKAFGLVVADALGLAVPATTVVARRVAPFHFGRPTGTGESWIRTAPREPVPGRFTTRKGWTDPFELLTNEDADEIIASVISQEGVRAGCSGAAHSTVNGQLVVEGVRGSGEAFMQGAQAPEHLPSDVVSDVREVHARIRQILGPSRFEWVHDGRSVWIVQLHAGPVPSTGSVIYPGEPKQEHSFDVNEGLEELRRLVESLAGTGEGVVLEGDVGVTSHFGDVLRAAKVPSRLKRDPVVR